MDSDLVLILEGKIKTLENQLAIVTSNWHKAEIKNKPDPQIQQVIKPDHSKRIQSLQQQLRALQDSKNKNNDLVDSFEQAFEMAFNLDSIRELESKSRVFDKLQSDYNQLKLKYSATLNKKPEEPKTIIEEKIVFVEKEVIRHHQIQIQNTFHENQCKQEMDRLKALLKHQELSSQ